MLPAKCIQELIIEYADAVVLEDNKRIEWTLAQLRTGGYSLAGYIGAPVLCYSEKVIAQVTFHYTKKNTLRRKNPYTVTYP